MSDFQKLYFVIREEHGAPIVAEYTRRYTERLATLSALAGVPVKYPQVREGMSGQWVTLSGVNTDTAPTEDGWKPDPETAGLYVPNIRRKTGKVLAATLREMDASGFLHVLEERGVNPWPDFGSPFRSACAGHGRFDDVILLVWRDDWKRRADWPAWVEQIKGSEFYAIQEAYQERHAQEASS